MSKKNKGIIQRFRPDGFDALVPGLVEDCMKAGGLEPENEEEKVQQERFIRLCIGVGADAILEGIRALGAGALLQQGKIRLVLSPVAVPGRSQYLDLPLKYKDQAGYAGPGRLVFIPNDKEIFKLPPGSLSGGGN